MIHFPSPSLPDTFCIVLAGGKGSRLHELTAAECKPALPFAGGRLVDFSLENAAASGVARVLVAVQYRPGGLVRHLQHDWRHRFPGGLDIADGAGAAAGEYRGTADVVRAHLRRIEASGADAVLVLSADHVYRMDYRAMLAAHRASGAMVTVAVDEVPLAQAAAFGVLSAREDGRITEFAEKPLRPQPAPDNPAKALVSMGVYVLDRRWLEQVLTADPARHDFGNDILPEAVAQGLAQVHRPGAAGGFYWRDVGTLDSYRRAQLDFLSPRPPFAPPASPSPAALAAAAQGNVLLPGARLSSRARVSRAILAPGAVVPDGVVIGADPDRDRRWFRVSPLGTVLVTPAMLARHAAETARPVTLPFLSVQGG